MFWLASCDTMRNNDAVQIFANKLKARHDSLVTSKGKAKSIQLLANDSIPNGTTIQVRMTQAKKGVMTLQSDNNRPVEVGKLTFLYAPEPNFVGNDEVTYFIESGAVKDSAKVFIKVLDTTILCVPILKRDTIFYDQSLSSFYDVFANNNACGGQIAIIKHPKNGRVTIEQTGIRYNRSFNANALIDEFEYSVCYSGACDTARVTVLPRVDSCATLLNIRNAGITYPRGINSYTIPLRDIVTGAVRTCNQNLNYIYNNFTITEYPHSGLLVVEGQAANRVIKYYPAQGENLITAFKYQVRLPSGLTGVGTFSLSPR